MTNRPPGPTGSVLPYALTIFTGAFLLFQVQPLIAKHILPWFGGGPAVWTTCMLFFQVLLLVGYVYAHLSVRYLKPRVQAGLHVALILVAVAQLPITPTAAWKPLSVEAPTWQIMALLGASLGLPYLVLSSTTPLTQAWFSQGRPGVSPYRLYALSNLGSLLALVSYPVLVEPYLTRQAQATLWALGFGLFVVTSGFCVVRAWRRGAPDTVRPAACAPPDEDALPPTLGTRVLWVTLPACAALLLLAVTNQITMDLVVIPFLWVLPLSLYLLTFIICFDHERWYVRTLFALGLIPAMAFAVKTIFFAQLAPVLEQIVVYSAVLFICCMVCHGELSRLKPHPRYLTGYYLMIALGGALGGVFVTLIAPLVFQDYLELPLGLVGVCALTLIVLFTDPKSRLYHGRSMWAWVPLLVGFLILGILLAGHVRAGAVSVIAQSRNFYGVLKVQRYQGGTDSESLQLRHGRIPHGTQFTAPAKRRLGTGYYAARSGGGLAIRFLPREHQRRIGLVGLGVGTLATFTRDGDSMRIYEINPEVRRLAETYFTYLTDSPADVEIIMGDARLSLEREPPQQFDLLILDAFTGDAIPVHLLTREAFETYLRHLKPDGVIALLIATYHLEFEPVVRRLADHFGLDAVRIVTHGGPNQDWGADWMILTRNRAFLESSPIAEAAFEQQVTYNQVRLWTDDYTSLFPILGLD